MKEKREEKKKKDEEEKKRAAMVERQLKKGKVIGFLKTFDWLIILPRYW